MFSYDFPTRPIDTFRHGSFPKVKQIAHNYQTPDWHYALHVHLDLIELIYVRAGTALIVVGKERHLAKKGDILLIDRGIPHSISSMPEDPSDVWTLSASNVVFCEQPPGKFIAASTQAGDNESFIEDAMKQIEAFSSRVDIPIQAACNHLCAALIVLFRQMLLQSSAVYDEREQSLASRILTYIDQNYNQHIDLDHLVGVFYLSKSHLSREFRNEYQLSPINYLIDKRLSEAKWRLLNTNESIQEISNAIGYDNVYYFAKLFTKKIGCAPSDYRARYLQKTV